MLFILGSNIVQVPGGGGTKENTVSFDFTGHFRKIILVCLQVAEAAVGIVPRHAEAFRAVSSKLDIARWLSAAAPVATVLLQPVAGLGAQPHLGPVGHQAMNINKARL